LDAFFHLRRNSKGAGNFIGLCSVSFGYRQDRIRKAVLELPGRKPAEPAGAQYAYPPWRENIREDVRWRII
jgi:hypothetical protein